MAKKKDMSLYEGDEEKDREESTDEGLAISPELKIKEPKQPPEFSVECPNCRAVVGQPCIWEDDSICKARQMAYERHQKQKN